MKWTLDIWLYINISFKVALIGLAADTTHVLQPLDTGAMGLLKTGLGAIAWSFS